MKAILRGKFIVIIGYIKKRERFQINNLTLHLKKLEKEDKTNPRAKEEIKRDLKNTLRQKQRSNILKFMGCRKGSSKKEVHSDKCPPQETRKASK